MAQTKPISVPVLPGMREDVSTHLAPVGTLRVARNVRFPVSGEAHARRGTRALPVATSADLTYQQALEGSGSSGPDYLAPCPGGFVFGCAGYGYRYDFDQDRVFVDGSYSNAVPAGKLATIAAEEVTYATGRSVPWPLSQAVGNGYVAIVWCGGSGAGDVGPATLGAEVRLQVFTEGGALVLNYSTDSYSAAWVVHDSTTQSFVLVVQDGVNLSCAQVSLSASGATLGAFTSFGTLISGTAYWAACGWPGVGWAIAYRVTTTSIRLRAFSGTTQTDVETFAVSTGTEPISLFCTATRLYVGWVEVDAIFNTAFARAYDTSLTLTSGGSLTLYSDNIGAALLVMTPPLLGASMDPDGCFAVIGRSLGMNSDDGNETWIVALAITDATVSGPSGTYAHAWPVSAPFNGGMVWCRLRTPNSSAYGNNYVRHALLDFMAERFPDSTSNRVSDPVVALLGEPFADLSANDYAGGSYRMHLCPPVQKVDGEWVAGLPRLVRSETADGVATGLATAEWLRFRTEAPRMARLVGTDVVVAGSPVIVANNVAATIHQFYAESPDTGRQAHGTDLGFLIQPPGLTVTGSLGGSLTLLGTYQYRAVIEWIDPEGRRWRSKPSRIYGGTLTGGDQTYEHTGPELQLFVRQLVHRYSIPSALVVHIYRTVDGGSTFYRATPAQGAPLASAPLGISYDDTLSDAELILREILYTDGGVLDNEHAPSCQYLTASEDRAWAAGLWDTKRVRSSKLLVPGEPIQFTESPAFDVVLPVECTGIAAQDGSVVLFGRNSIYAVLGGGPTDQGQGAWDTPRVVTRSTGCIDGRHVLETSVGVFFQSRRGIELLPRGLGEPQFIGAPVQELLFELGGSITGAAVITSSEGRTARFCTGTAHVLTLDLDTGAWSDDEYPAPVVAICDTDEGAVLALESVSAGGFGFLLESADAASDAEDDVPVAVASELEWAAIHPFTIAGWGRFNCAVGMFDELQPLGYQAGDCSLFVSIDNHTDVGATFDMQALAAPDYRKHTPAQMNGTAVRLKLTTEAGGWRFLGWTLDLDDHGGSRRVAESEAA